MPITKALFSISLLWMIVTPLAYAADRVESIPNMFYQNPFMTIEDVIFGSTCYSLRSSTNGMDCNAAHMHRNTKKQLRFNVMVDRRANDLIDYSQKLNKKDVVGLINKINEKNEATAARLAGSLWYQNDWWAVGYVPLRLKYASNIKNPAYPQIALSLIGESEVFAKAGVGFVDIDGLSAGVNLRYLSQQYIHREEDMFDVISDPDLFKIQKNELISLEPGLAYVFDNDAWKPELSLVITHLDVYSSNSKYKKLYPGVEVGFSSTPQFANGRLITSTHYSINEPNIHPFKRLRWGARYDWDGAFSVGASLAKGDYGVSVTTAFDSLTLGAAFKNEELDFARWKAKTSDTLMFEAGLRF